MLFWTVCAAALLFASGPARAATTPIYLVLTVLGPEGKPLPEFEALIANDGCGWLFGDGSQGFLDVLAGISTRRIEDKRARVAVFRSTLGWQDEEFRYLSVFDHINNSQHSIFREDPGMVIQG